MLGIVGEAPGEETPCVADSSAAMQKVEARLVTSQFLLVSYRTLARIAS